MRKVVALTKEDKELIRFLLNERWNEWPKEDDERELYNKLKLYVIMKYRRDK